MKKSIILFFMAALLIMALSVCQPEKSVELSQSVQEPKSNSYELSPKEGGSFAPIESHDKSSNSNEIDGKSAAESDIVFENFSDVHTITKNIVDDGIPLTFRFTNNYKVPIDIEDKFAFGIVTEYHIILDILDETGTFLQSVSFDAFSQFGLGYYQETAYKDCITDINFDGNRDILILDSVGGAKGNHYYLGWIYNPQTNQFDEVNLSSITNLAIDSQNKVLKSVVANTASSHTYSIYRYIDDQFILTNSLTAEMLYENNSRDYYYTEIELINGEMVEVSHLMDTQENVNELTARYGEDTIWNDFYNSDYGTARNG